MKQRAQRLSNFLQVMTGGAKTESQILSSMTQALLQGIWTAIRRFWILCRATSGLSISHKKQ